PELTTDENQSLIRKWWNSILEWIGGLYKESNIDIFQEAASQIMSGVGTVGETSGEVFFQLTETQKQIQDRIKETKQKVDKRVETIKSADPLLLDSEEANNYYVVQRPDGTWERVKKRVTDRVKAWYKERFGNKVFSEQEKEFNEMKRQYGVQGHADMEEIHSRYFHEYKTKKKKRESRTTKFNFTN